jgi:hypothetical protein
MRRKGMKLEANQPPIQAATSGHFRHRQNKMANKFSMVGERIRRFFGLPESCFCKKASARAAKIP